MNSGPGTYGPQTKAAVAAWQSATGVPTNGNAGYYGPASQQAVQKGGGSNTSPANTSPAGDQIIGTYNNQPIYAGQDVEAQVKAIEAGKTPVPMNGQGAPYFKGSYALVKIAGVDGYDSNTVWLVDVNDKTMRPFESDQAIAKFYGMPVAELSKSVNHVNADIFGQGNALSGFTPLSFEYAIKEDGRAKAYTGDASTLALRYGNANYDSNLEMAMTSGLDGFMDVLKNTPGISSSTIGKIGKDQSLMAFYISSLAYGGYTLGDIFKDIKRRDLIDKGDKSLEDVLPISPTQKRSQYQASSAFQRSDTLPSLRPPANIGNLSPDTLSLPLYDVPDEAFKTLIPLLNPDSPEFWQKMDEATSVIYEAQLQMLEAKTDQELQAAQTQWDLNKKSLEKTLGISLSNNAMEAWTQIEGYRDKASSQGIYGSGLVNEKVDDYLRQVRTGDQRNRDETLTKEEEQEREYFTKFASPEEVKTLDPVKAQKWGLVPSQDIKDYFTIANLKNLFPKERPEALQGIIDQYMDPNGNLYSSLYNKYNTDKYNTTYDPTSGYNTWKSGKVMGDALLNEEEKYGQYTTPDSPFLRYTGEGVDIPKNAGVTAPKTVNLSSEAKKAMSGLLNRPTTGNTTPATATPPPTSTNVPRNVQPVPQTPPTSTNVPRNVQPVPQTPPKTTIGSNAGTGLSLSTPTAPSWTTGIKLPSQTAIQAPAYKPTTNTNQLTGTGVTNSNNIFSKAWNWMTGK